MMLLASLLTVPFVQTAPSQAVPTFHCEARTPAGDTLALEVFSAKGDKEALPTLFIRGDAGSAWPQAGRTYVGLPVRAAGDGFEFSLGRNFVRLGATGAVRNLTILSEQDGKPSQALAFGFCGTAALDASPAPTAAIASREVFSPARWQNRCFFTAPGPGMVRGSFELDHSIVDGALVASFEPKEGGIWPAPMRVPRQIARPSPKSEAPGISLGVGRFAPIAGEVGPTGMDMIFIDDAAKRASIVVRFDSFKGTDQPGFAICGVPNFKDKVQ